MLLCLVLPFQGKGIADKTYINHPLPKPGCGTYDKNGINRHDYKGKIGYQYNPLFICNDALDYYADYFYRPSNFLPNPQYKTEFFKIVKWLLAYSEKDGLNSIRIPYKFTISGRPAPWYSGVTQARAARVLALAYVWERDEKYIEVAEKLINYIFLPIKKGGFTYKEKNLTYFEEYTHPAPNHVLNGHMSILLDLAAIRDELKKIGKKLDSDDIILSHLTSGMKTLKLVLPLYENISTMNLGLCMKQGDTFKNPHVIENTHKSYDLIHLKYLTALFELTQDDFFKDSFYKYYIMIGLSQDLKKNMNVLSNEESSIIADSGFPKEGPHSLLSAFKNFYKDPKVYAAGSFVEKNGYFIVDFGKIKEIEKIEMRFHWDDFPKNFTILAQKGKKWIPICSEKNWSAGPGYEKKLSFPVKTRKIKFIASNFSNQRRILLDYMYIFEKNNKKSFNLYLIKFFTDRLKNQQNDISLVNEDVKKRYRDGKELFNFSFLQM